LNGAPTVATFLKHGSVTPLKFPSPGMKPNVQISQRRPTQICMASDNRNPRGGSISLEDLSALNEEILALVRAGVPLEAGLGKNVTS
jgi:hypothetical protein